MYVIIVSCTFQLIRQQAERINEMTSVMYKAVTLDENNEARKEDELFHRLVTENKVTYNYSRNDRFISALGIFPILDFYYAYIALDLG